MLRYVRVGLSIGAALMRKEISDNATRKCNDSGQLQQAEKRKG